MSLMIRFERMPNPSQRRPSVRGRNPTPEEELIDRLKRDIECLERDHDRSISNHQSTNRKLRQSIFEQSETINKLQQEILELKTMMENISG